MALLSFVTVPLFVPLVYSLGLYPGLEMEVVNVSLVLLVIILILGNRSGLPRRHVQVYLLMTFWIQGIQRRGDGKDCAPLPPKEWEVRWACLAIFFLALGLRDFCTWVCLETAFGGNRLIFFSAGQSSRRG